MKKIIFLFFALCLNSFAADKESVPVYDCQWLGIKYVLCSDLKKNGIPEDAEATYKINQRYLENAVKEKGLLVVSIDDHSPFRNVATNYHGFIIYACEGKRIRSPEYFEKILLKCKPNSFIEFSVYEIGGNYKYAKDKRKIIITAPSTPFTPKLLANQ